MQHPKSGKISTFSHNVGQKWGFCWRVKGVRFKKSTSWVQKVHFGGGGFRTTPKSILDTGQNKNTRIVQCIVLIKRTYNYYIVYQYLDKEFVSSDLDSDYL